MYKGLDGTVTISQRHKQMLEKAIALAEENVRRKEQWKAMEKESVLEKEAAKLRRARERISSLFKFTSDVTSE